MIQEDVNDEQDFRHQQGATPTNGTGPSSDHTSGTGMVGRFDYLLLFFWIANTFSDNHNTFQKLSHKSLLNNSE